MPDHEMSCLILDSHWVSPQKVLDNGFVFKFEEINNALENIFNKKD
jgi:NAD dependent epimerase/dehydratase family enzyme